MNYMRCPRGDGELIARASTGVGGIPLTYYLCLACLGHWTLPFDANYLPLSALPDTPATEEVAIGFRCPHCLEPLERAHKEAMAPDVLAWYCPSGHGYFFPRGNLRKFRAAQEARVTYHKLWQIPAPAIGGVLLTSALIFMLITSVVLVTHIRDRQQTVSQAQSIIAARRVIISRGTVAIIAQTSVPSQLRLRLQTLGADALMQSSDGLTHEILLRNVAPGTYTYSLLLVQGETEITSPVYDFYVPDLTGTTH